MNGSQITDTIASVRRQRQYTDGDVPEDIDIRVHVSREGARRSEFRDRLLFTPGFDGFVGKDEASFEAERSFVRAPLNSRVVSSSGPRDKGKGKAKESSLYGVPIDIQEALVLEDLLFVLMVCPGFGHISTWIGGGGVQAVLVHWRRASSPG